MSRVANSDWSRKNCSHHTEASGKQTEEEKACTSFFVVLMCVSVFVYNNNDNDDYYRNSSFAYIPAAAPQFLFFTGAK